MAKYVADSMLDAAFNLLKTTGNVMTLCSGQPANRADAVTNMMLAQTAMATGDYTVADGDTSGRKITVAAKNAVSVTNSGSGTYIAICDGTTLLFVTTCTLKVVVAGDTVNFPSWKDEIADPA